MDKRLLISLIPILILAVFMMINVVEDVKMKNSEVFVALGDSLTHGVGDQQGSGYVGDLQYLLKENQQEEVTVENHGIPGQQSDGLLAQLGQPEVLNDVEEADYITVFIGMNDLVKSNGKDLNPIREDRLEIGKEDYEHNLQKIFKIIREKNPDARILFLGLYNPYPSSDKIQQVIDEWNRSSQQIVKQHDHMKFIPTDNLFEEKSHKYFSDSLHPNKSGYKLITQRIVKEYDF
ncbi:DUF459 domain-containing protein [Pseudalkalibacillus sp. Hm43]|uniref:DUF459 domain-containing protein n=1 Tax=Pseudalkalibacillus sp. Hm43 TaxID=3450742 RepID=UPI003F43BDE5